MERYPFSTFALSIATAIQAAFFAWGVTMSVWLVGLWTVVTYVFFAEQVWRNELTKDLSRKYKILIWVVALVILVPTVAFPFLFRGIRIETGNTKAFFTEDTDGDTWVRAKAYNAGPRDAKCRAHLINLKKDGLPESIIEDEHLELWAANGGDRDFPQGFTIPSSSARYFNIAAVLGKEKEKNLMSIPSQEYYDRRPDPPLTPGTYRLTVEVGGPDCGPTSKDISIRYDGSNRIFFLLATQGSH